MGLELVDVEFVKEGGRRYLRLFIDKEGGITLEDCTSVSRAVEVRLDELDPIQEPYTFEVSSPGLERPLKRDADFARFAGQMIRLSTFAPIDGQRAFVGELLGIADGQVRLRLRPESKEQPASEMAIPREQVAMARLYVEF